MPETPPRLVRACLDSLMSGLAEFDRDWPANQIPRLVLGPGGIPIVGVAPAPPWMAGEMYAYSFIGRDEFAFVLPRRSRASLDRDHDRVYVGGDFNGWQEAVGDPSWELLPAEFGGEPVLIWRGSPARVLSADPARFKFVTGEHQWLAVENDAPNAVSDEHGNINRLADPARTGRHLWRFTVKGLLDLSEAFTLSSGGSEPITVGLGEFFLELGTDLPLGASVKDGRTHFRFFAPRARRVLLHFSPEPIEEERAEVQPLLRRLDADGARGVWEGTVERDLDRWYYWYTLDGVHQGPAGFDPNRRILDPYAAAAVGPAGPGIILSPARLGRAERDFRTPSWQDLVIVEAHVRDLAARAPVPASDLERRGFTGLRRWVESPEFYLQALGANCVELQPVHQSDNRSPESYSWGYMTTNFFAPEATYALDPEAASGIGEFRELVAAFHRRGMAVLIDVVFNHVGDPAHLMAIDRPYYFESDSEGGLSNWSGVGNDLRADSAMAKRLIIDSCLHWIEVFGVDGFRFDLAELLGVEVLREIEAALKRAKPDVVLIAEPWSFRGHIASALRDTGWASWNDGYRDFLREYVLGRGSAERLEYFLRGSPWYFAKWPAQTVNYTQSHDDRSWIDTITENPGNDGEMPTANDRRRTRLMAALLFSSIGIPMLAEGQDFLWSKRGENNTYLRGDLNILDYRRLDRFRSTHVYFAEWIAFRRGPFGRFLRQYSRPSEGFFRFFRGTEEKAAAVLFNADGSQGPERLLLAVNPLLGDASISLGEPVASLGPWRQRADQDRFYGEGSAGWRSPVEPELFLPPLGCGLWTATAG